MRFRLTNDTDQLDIKRNTRGIALLDSENDTFIKTSSLPNITISYDQLTNTPQRAPANWEETDETSISFIQNRPNVMGANDSYAAGLVAAGSATHNSKF